MKRGSERNPVLDPDAVFLMDGSSYIFRAFYAIKDLKTSGGIPTNAIYGFTNMLLKVLDEYHPRYLAVVLDAAGPTFRHHLFEAYKANRPEMPESLAPQIPIIKEIIEAMGIKILEMEGYEADDIIGTLVKRWASSGRPCVIVSGDKDLLQLVQPGVLIIDTMFERWFDEEAVRERYGVEPIQITDLLGLMGDASDNVPGVPGIGMKRASELIGRFGSVEEVIKHARDISQASIRKALMEHTDQALLSKQLVTIEQDVPIDLNPEDLRVGGPDKASLREIFKRLEFHRLLQRYTDVEATKGRHPTVVSQPRQLDELIGEILKEKRLSIQVDTPSNSPMLGPVLGVSICVKSEHPFFLPLDDRLSRDRVFGGQCGDLMESLRPYLEDPSIEKVGHDLKRSIIALRKLGIRLNGLSMDTMVASYLLNPSRRTHELDDLSMELLDERLPAAPKRHSRDDTTPGKEGSVTMGEAEIERCCARACASLRLSEVFARRLRDGGLDGLFRELELPLIGVLATMEMNGVRVDREALDELSKELEARLAEIQKEIFDLAGERFNINSHQQLSQVLFERLKLPVIKKTKTGFGTDVEVLQELSKSHQLPAKILEYRSLSKLKSTYIDALPRLINPQTGRIHTSFNQAVAATGRLTSSEPNLQNIPIRGELGKRIRCAFVPQEGWWMFSADYNQVELRILAHLSGDPILIEAFMHDQDIHRRTASEIFGVPDEMVNQQMRRQAKVINFGVIYGMSAYGLSRELGVEPKVAQAYIEGYFQRYKGVRQYIEETVERARRERCVETILGRRRYLQEISSPNRAARRFAERVAINTPIQGSAADMIKKAMIRIQGQLESKGFRSRMILQIHDELLFEAPPEERDPLQELVLKEMQEVERLRVPLKVECGWGRSWAEAH